MKEILELRQFVRYFQDMFLRLFFLCFPFLGWAAKMIHPLELQQEEFVAPWFTGPLVTPSAHTLPQGHFNLETYFNVVINTGEYNAHWGVDKNPEFFYANSIAPIFQLGVSSFCDFELTPTVYYNYTDGAASWVFGDLIFTANFQLFIPNLKENPNTWAPSVKLTLREQFPTGQYEELDPRKKGTDVGGNGSYITSFGLVFGKIFDLNKERFLSTRLLLQYTIPAPTNLNGLNAYGGASDTNVKFYPSQSAQIDFGLETNITKNWAFAFDLAVNWARGSDYSGDPGTGIDLNPPQIGIGDPSWQFSIAPAIEYNWSSQLGIIAGSWFTVAGQNSSQFYSAIIALNYYN